MGHIRPFEIFLDVTIEKNSDLCLKLKWELLLTSLHIFHVNIDDHS